MKSALVCLALLVFVHLAISQSEIDPLQHPDYIVDYLRPSPRVAIYATVSRQAYLDDVAAKVRSINDTFSGVDVFEISNRTPNVTELNQYDSILVFSDHCFENATAFGDNLYDYVLEGGGLVVMPFSFEDCIEHFKGDCVEHRTCQPGIRGRIADMNRTIGVDLTPQLIPQEAGANRILPFGAVNDTSAEIPNQHMAKLIPQHPIFYKVNTFIDGDDAKKLVPLHMDPDVFGRPRGSVPQPFYDIIGVWNDDGIAHKNGSIYDTLLVGEKETFHRVAGKIVALNFFPPSSDVRAGGWDSRTDGAQLMANSLAYTARRRPCLIPTNNETRLRVGLLSDYNGAFLVDVADKIKPFLPFNACVAAHSLDPDQNTDRPEGARPYHIPIHDPTADELLAAYDAVLVFGSDTYGMVLTHPNASLLGDSLAEYADRGGGVIVAATSLMTGHPNESFVQFRPTALFDANHTLFSTLQDEATLERLFSNYAITACNASALTLNPATVGHPILANVSGFSGGLVSRRNINLTLATGASLVAVWSDGLPLIAERVLPSKSAIVALNFFPPSSDVDLAREGPLAVLSDRCRDTDIPVALWDARQNNQPLTNTWMGGRLMAQALLHAMRQPARG